MMDKWVLNEKIFQLFNIILETLTSKTNLKHMLIYKLESQENTVTASP